MKNKNIFKLIIQVISATSIVALFIAAFLFLSHKSTPLGCTTLDTSGCLSKLASVAKKNIPKAYVVQSGSMEPAIKTGSLVVTLPSDSYYKNDIITFKKDSSNTLVTHRIYAKTYPNGIESQASYLTAGDANEDFDRWDVTDSNIVGKVVYNIPYLGYLANLAKTPQGFILLIIVPSTIIIYEEFKTISVEIKKSFSSLIRRYKKKIKTKKIDDDNTSHNVGTNIYLKYAAIIPIFGTILVLAGLASSYFFDEEDSLGNVFSAATEFVSPITAPQTDGIRSQEVVINLANKAADSQYGYTHDYSNANVSFTYETPADDVLAGNVVATGLKPYATYQLKFEATPTCIDPVNGDDVLNENIGLIGRWWDNTDNHNLNSTPTNNDTFYFANSKYHGGSHCIIGYLVWDYITADASGNTSKLVSTSNSFHVLWCGGGACNTYNNDQLHNLDGSPPANFPYCSPTDVDGQIERSSCGGLILDPGDYHLNMILNEESFHQNSYGEWTAVMDAPLDFTIY